MGPAEICQNLCVNSEPHLTGITGHQWTQLLLTVSQIVQFCTHVLGVERNINMLVSKDEVIQYGSGAGSGKSHWPFRLDWSNGMLWYSYVSVRVPYPNCGPDTGWREGYAKKWETTYHHRHSGSFNSPGEFEESSHHCSQPTYALFRTSWQAGVCTDNQEPTTCFPVEIPKSCPEASPNSWSNNWVNWWPVLPVRCGSLLALRDFGKFLLDPTSLLWAYLSYVIMILGHNMWHIKGKWFTYKMIQSAYL